MSEVILYTTDDGTTRIDLRFEDGTVWLSQLELAELFQTSKQNISKHIKAIFDDQELSESATVNQKLTVQNEGGRGVSRKITLYNLDVILAVGYKKYKAKTLASVEQDYLRSIATLEKQAKEESRKK
jgi:hypothetical protein